VCSCALCCWPAQFWFCAGRDAEGAVTGLINCPLGNPHLGTTARRASRAPGTAPPSSSLTSEVGPYLKTAPPDGTACKGLCNTTNCIYSNQSCVDYCAVSAGAPCNYSATCTADSCTCQSGACKNAFVPGASCASCASGDCLVSDTGDCVEFCAANSNGTTCASCSNPDGCKCSGGQCVDLCLYLGADASPSVGGSCSCTETGVCSPPDLGVYAADRQRLRHRAFLLVPTGGGRFPAQDCRVQRKFLAASTCSSSPIQSDAGCSRCVCWFSARCAGCLQPDVRQRHVVLEGYGPECRALPAVPLLLQLTSVTNIGTCGYSNGICPLVSNISTFCSTPALKPLTYNGGVVGLPAGYTGYYALAMYWAPSSCLPKTNPSPWRTLLLVHLCKPCMPPLRWGGPGSAMLVPGPLAGGARWGCVVPGWGLWTSLCPLVLLADGDLWRQDHAAAWPVAGLQLPVQPLRDASAPAPSKPGRGVPGLEPVLQGLCRALARWTPRCATSTGGCAQTPL